MEDFLQGGFPQLRPHQQDDHGDHQPGDILQPPVAEGVVLVRGLGGQLEAQQGDHGGTGVGEVVYRVGGDGDGAAENSGQELSCEEEEVQADAHAAAQNAVGPADRRGGDIFGILDEMPGKETDHGTPQQLPPDSGGGYFFPGMTRVY